MIHHHVAKIRGSRTNATVALGETMLPPFAAANTALSGLVQPDIHPPILFKDQ
jgi:hypothetical protein